MKKIAIILGGITLLVALAFGYKMYTKERNDANVDFPFNGTYVIGGEKITLRDGFSEVAIVPGSATKLTTRYFGNDVRADLDGDGTKDSAFIVVQDQGGSGIFYYVTALLNKASGAVGTEGVFIGDRIAPQSTEMDGDVVVVNYADRKPEDSFDIDPSVGKTLRLKLNPTTLQFGEIVQDFEGEADPSKMSLSMQTWTWIQTTQKDGTEIIPKKEKAFTLTFTDESSFTATTDCNTAGGGYLTSTNSLAFNNIFSTLMYCEDSQESEYTTMLNKVETYSFTSKGELIFRLKDGGTATFR